MKTVCYFVFLILMIFSPMACADREEAEAPEPAVEKIVERPLTAQEIAAQKLEGEVITFGIYSTGIFKVGSGRLAYLGMSGTGEGAASDRSERHQTVDFTVSSFSVNDHERIMGTRDFVSPVRVIRDVRVFGKDEHIVEHYTDEGHRVTIRKRVEEEEPVETEITSPKPLGNVLLLIYRLRCDPELAVGTSYDITLPTTAFKLTVKDIRPLKVPLGRFDAFYIESEPKKYRIWLSADKRRLPLRIQGLAGGGLAYLAAVKVEPPLRR